MLILNKKKEFVWNDIKRHSSDAHAYLERLINFKVDEVTIEIAEFVRERIESNPECTVEKLKNVSSAVSKILVWLLAVLDSSEQRFAAQAEWGD